MIIKPDNMICSVTNKECRRYSLDECPDVDLESRLGIIIPCIHWVVRNDSKALLVP